MSRRPLIVRTGAVFGLAATQLRRSPGRTVLTVLAVALAVLSVTLLASLGVGVIEVGEQGLDQAERDVWIAGEPVASGTNGAENPIAGAHSVAADVRAREDVRTASPVAMHDVYIGTQPDELRRVSAVGVQSTHQGFDFESGGGFELTQSDYTETPRGEPARNEIVLDPRTADRLGVEVGDTVYVGASRQTAGAEEFTVVGTSSHYSRYLGSPAATMPILDLQAITGTAGTDRATFVMVDTVEGAAPATVSDDLQSEYPAYDVRTSDQHVEKLLEQRPLVLASGATLVGFAVIGGAVLTVNLFALVAYQQRDELAALRAIGLSNRLLAGIIGAQGLVIGVLGGVLGVAATRPAAIGLNRLARSVVGIERLLRTPVEIYAAGFAIAIVVGTVVAGVASWQAGRYARIEQLQA